MAGLDAPRAVVETFSVHLRYQLVATGRFLSGMPASVLLHQAGQTPLKVLPVDLPARPWPVAMISLRNRTVSPLVQAFMTCVREVCARMDQGATERPGPRPVGPEEPPRTSR